MSFMLLGILNSQAAGGAVGSYDLLATEILTGSSSSITFASLGDYAADYQHLQIRAVSRLSAGGGQEAQGAIRFNGDSASNYSSHWLLGNGSSVGSAAFTSANHMKGLSHSLNAATTGNFGVGVIDILDPFETTKYKTIRSLTATASASIFLTSGNWRNTDAISSVTLQGPTDQSWQIVTGSRFSLYGIRKAA
jgi:hypothetical protein